MRFLYWPGPKLFVFLVFICIFSLELLPLSLILYAFLALIFVLFRRSKDRDLSLLQKSKGAIYSPVFGVVKQIKEGVDIEGADHLFTRVTIQVPIHFEYGLKMPLSSEIKDIQYSDGKKIFRFQDQDLQKAKLRNVKIFFENKSGQNVSLELMSCRLALDPVCWISPGDRGLSGSSFGYLPFGGLLNVYINGEDIVLCEENQIVNPGQSLLACQNI